MCVRESSSVCQELKVEPYRIRRYVQERFKDITSLIKTAPIGTCASFVALVGAIYFVALPVFLTLSAVVTLNYLDSTYFCQESTPWSMSFWGLFYDLHNLQTWQPSQGLKELVQESIDDKFTENQRELLKMFDFSFEDFEKDFAQEMREKRKAYEEDRRSVVLFLRAKADHNGALCNQDRSITINGDNNKGVQELQRKYKIALIDKITHVDQIKEGLGKITNPIQQVWILAHGSPTSMQLEGHHKISSREIDELAPLLQQKLSADAHVILDSCSTSQKVSSGENIATKFSRILPGRTIWAANLPTSFMTYDLGEGDSLKVNFWNVKSRLKYLKEKIWNICRLRPFKKIDIKLNVTTKIKDDIECLSAA